MTEMTQPGLFAPAPGAASGTSLVVAQTRTELWLTLRRGESVLLTLIIPVLLLVAFSTLDVLPTRGGGDRVDFLAPGILALAIMSTAFTGQAIATAFEREYGVLRRLAVTPLPRWALLAGKTLAVLAVEAVQVLLLAGVALLLGWSPRGSVLSVLVLLLLGTAAFSGLGLLLAGALRGTTVLAAANGLYLVLLLLGGVVFPLQQLPSGLAALARLLPTAALSDGLRSVLQAGAGLSLGPVLVLAAWALVCGVLAARTFRWE